MLAPWLEPTLLRRGGIDTGRNQGVKAAAPVYKVGRHRHPEPAQGARHD
ncbi:MAG TPA: hypothetical protein VED46_09655 [Alphaproteobacteria bacterium]|nr:hypothetical protein [Alphaproteobacteria bacterium]